MHDFATFAACCMLYFAAAIQTEEAYLCGDAPAALWLAENLEFNEVSRSWTDRFRQGRDVGCDRPASGGFEALEFGGTIGSESTKSLRLHSHQVDS